MTKCKDCKQIISFGFGDFGKGKELPIPKESNAKSLMNGQCKECNEAHTNKGIKS